jgi:hypothetical protein
MVACEHRKEKSRCAECGGSQICQHKKEKRYCKDCKGSGICEHNINKTHCKECGGSQICKHKKNKTHCKECGGSAYCEHDKIKVKCKICKGGSICDHNKIKYTCKECGGSRICKHKKDKSYCKECGGSAFCEHNKIKKRCKECGGSAFCEHDKRKEHCKECGFCNHDKRKVRCIICSPHIACNNCKLEIMSQYKKYKPYCFKCYCVLNPDIEIPRRYKTKECLLAKELTEMNLGIDFIQDKKIDGGCSRRRPDFLFDLFTHTLIVECDENGHKDYNTTCEISKLNDTFTDLADRPMILIRFNPDKCEETGKSCFDKECRLIKTEWNKRIKVLKKEIQNAIKNIPDELVIVKYLF